EGDVDTGEVGSRQVVQLHGCVARGGHGRGLARDAHTRRHVVVSDPDTRGGRRQHQEEHHGKSPGLRCLQTASCQSASRPGIAPSMLPVYRGSQEEFVRRPANPAPALGTPPPYRERGLPPTEDAGGGRRTGQAIGSAGTGGGAPRGPPPPPPPPRAGTRPRPLFLRPAWPLLPRSPPPPRQA